jgi:type 1 fimbria pilin
MRNTRSLLIGVLLASAGNAIAASSVDLTVKGSITPSACTPLLSSGGVADFGKISVKDLRPDNPTYLSNLCK